MFINRCIYLSLRFSFMKGHTFVMRRNVLTKIDSASNYTFIVPRLLYKYVVGRSNVFPTFLGKFYLFLK